MKKFKFRKIFAWMPWITLLLVGGILGLFVLDFFEMWARDIGILIIFLGIMVLTFAVDSMMKENPEYEMKYFLHWIIVVGLFMFFALSIWVWFL